MKYKKNPNINYSEVCIESTTNLYAIYVVIVVIQRGFGLVNMLSNWVQYSEELLYNAWGWLSLYQTIQDNDKSRDYLHSYFALPSLKAFVLY